MSYILSIDQGTTGTTCVLISATTFELTDKINTEHDQIYPRPSLVEHNLNQIWDNVIATIEKLLKKNNITGDQIKAIGITNQRETTCAFDKKGNPLHNAIVWQDRRTSDYCKELKLKTVDHLITQKTGLPVDPYFSASKMNWLINNCDKVKIHLQNNDLLLGTIDTFLLYKLTNGRSFKTEASNASRTLLMNLETCQWDRELLSIFGVDKCCLPQICNSMEIFGYTDGLNILPDGIPISGILGDQQAALFGQAGIEKGDLKCTYGTGAFMLLNTGDEIKRSKSGLLSTVFYQHNDQSIYALEGSTYIAGAVVGWLRDNLNFISDSSEIERLAGEVKELHELEHIMFLPFFTGIGSPYWNSDAKAAIVGLTRDSKKSHIAHAALEGMALSINDLIDIIKSETGINFDSMKVDGGASANNLLMKLQATISNLSIIRPKIIETTAYGVALAAAIGSKLTTLDNIKSLWHKDKEIKPNRKQSDFYAIKKGKWNEWIRKLYLS